MTMKAFITELARRGGEIAMGYRRRLSGLRIDPKGARDMVTEADIAVEEFLIGEIRKAYPEHAILGEESGSRAGNAFRWVIDPIDGTLSFLRGQPDFSISIGLEEAGRLVAGAVYMPVLGELFCAERGRGTDLNGEPVRVSETASVGQGLFGTGFACVRNECGGMNLFYLPRIVPRIFGMRRYGSAAMHLAYVACGRLDGFWEFGLGEHDIAGGRILIEEAGGRFTDFAGGEAGLPGEAAATNGRLHEEFLAMMRELTEAYRGS